MSWHCDMKTLALSGAQNDGSIFVVTFASVALALVYTCPAALRGTIIGIYIDWATRKIDIYRNFDTCVPKDVHKAQ